MFSTQMLNLTETFEHNKWITFTVHTRINILIMIKRNKLPVIKV